MRVALLALALAVAGCRSVPEAVDMKPEEAYQAVANNLPRGDFGWGDPSGLAELAASSRTDRPKDPQPIELKCNERGMTVVVDVFRPHGYTVRYDTIEEVTYSYEPFPNLVFCFLFPFLQFEEARVVFDARKLDGFFDQIESDCTRLEAISREVGMSGPWEHAQAVRRKLADDAAEFGEGRVSLHFNYVSPVPPFIPYTAPARQAAEALRWVKDHPNEPVR